MLTDDNYQQAAQTLNVEVAAIKAVTLVETNGSSFISPGIPTILFERHVMYRLLTAKGIPTAGLPTDIVNPVPGGYGLYSAQHARLDRAVQIDRDCALQSCSWGGFQLMGFNYRQCGFTSIQAFVNAMYKDELSHLMAFCAFIQSNSGMLTALQNKDWTAFASKYNGPNYRANNYDTKLAQAYSQSQ